MTGELLHRYCLVSIESCDEVFSLCLASLIDSGLCRSTSCHVGEQPLVATGILIQVLIWGLVISAFKLAMAL